MRGNLCQKSTWNKGISEQGNEYLEAYIRNDVIPDAKRYKIWYQGKHEVEQSQTFDMDEIEME